MHLDHRKLSILIGTNFLPFNGSTPKGGLFMTVEEVFVNEDFNPINFHHDIAVIKLKEKVKISRFVQPICLNSKIRNFTTGRTVGWGAIDDEGNLPYIANIADFDLTKYDESSHEIKATSDKNWICEGDSGSGLFTNVSRKFYLIGVASSKELGKNCSQKSEAYFVDVSKYLSFIMNIKNNIKC